MKFQLKPNIDVNREIHSIRDSAEFTVTYNSIQSRITSESGHDILLV